MTENQDVWEQFERVKFRHGFKKDDKYYRLAHKIAKTVIEKQAAYGDSFGKSGDVMRILYPDGISHEQMDDALAVVRIVDKLFRLATSKNAFGENPFFDICGYGLLGAAHAKNTEGRDRVK